MSQAEKREAKPSSNHIETMRLAERVAVLLLLAVLLYGVAKVVEPFGAAIALGSFIAIGTWPVRTGLVARGMQPGMAATVLLSALILATALPLLMMAPGLADQISGLAGQARRIFGNLPAEAPVRIAAMPLLDQAIVRTWTRLHELRGDVHSLLGPYSAQIREMLVEIGQAAAASVVQVLLALAVAAMFWTNGDRVSAQLRDMAERLGGATGIEAMDAAGGAVRGVAWGVVGTGILQAVLMGIGLAIAGVPGATALGFLTMIFSISQILGPLIVVTWGGAAVWLYGKGDLGWAAFMLAWGAIAVSGSDNIVRPLLIQQSSAMPLALIILGVFGGMIAFGFLGLFLGPALLAVGHGLLKAWRQPRLDVPQG